MLLSAKNFTKFAACVPVLLAAATFGAARAAEATSSASRLQSFQLAQTPSLQIVEESRALKTTLDIYLFPGRQSLIEFKNGEKIEFIQLADITQIVYTTNYKLESGDATVILLRTIQPLRLEGVVSPPPTYPTNITVGTRRPDGTERTYTFNVIADAGGSKPHTNGISIVSDRDWEVATAPTAVRLESGTAAAVSDISKGLTVALKVGYVPPTDPVVEQVRAVLALSRNGVPLVEASRQVGLSFRILEALAEIGWRDGLSVRENRGENFSPRTKPNFIPAVDFLKKSKVSAARSSL